MELDPESVGMEVPILGSDSVEWIEVPILSSNELAATADADTCAPLTHDCASSIAIGDPPTYLIWIIHKDFPRTLELLELSAKKEFPKVGLRINFPEALSSSVFLCKNEIDIGSRSHPYLLYALTVAGVAYLLKLGTTSSYAPSSVIREFNLHPYGPISSAAATPTGCLVVGQNDGSLACFQLTLESTAPGFLQELRDDSGTGSFWGFMSRGRTVGAVQDLVISMVHGKPLIFVIHTDWVLRVWDLSFHGRLFANKMNGPTVAGAASVRLWVGQADNDSSIIPVAILYRHNSDISSETIYVYRLHCNVRDRIELLIYRSKQIIPIEDGWIDVKLISNKICILKNHGLVFLKLLHINAETVDAVWVDAVCYPLQEDFVADQLFQSSKHSSDDLLLITHSIFSSSRDHILPVVSSIFLRRLLLPGIHHNAALRATLLDYNRHWTESDFHSLTADGLKKEILSLIEHEALTGNSSSIFCCWEIFCARYFQNWCKSNAPCGLLVDSSTGTVGLIRKSSVSFFRSLEDIERVNDGSLDELGNIPSFGLDSFGKADCKLLAEMLRCVTNVSQQLGKTASAIFYELLISAPPVISSKEIIPRLLKILETGYSSTAAALWIADLGTDLAWEKNPADHKNLRKFSFDMMKSLHALHEKSGTWSRILSVIEKYLKYLIPRKIIQKFDAEVALDINASILVPATFQVAKVMFESALDIHLFLSYLVSISRQINMLHDDISKIQRELVPMIQEVIYEWLLLHFFATTPSESVAFEDFSSQLSLLQIDSNTGRRLCNEKLGKCEFTLAFIFLLNVRSSSKDQNHFSPRSIPSVEDIIDSVREFDSWTMWGQDGESLTVLKRVVDLALILLRHGQYDAVEHLLTIVEAHLEKEETSHGIRATDGGWCILHHLLGCCFLAQAHRGVHGVLKERKVHEAVRCFFRAASGSGSAHALQSLPQEAWLPHLGIDGSVSDAAWRLHYYQWAMQICEHYNISEGACQFALAALEQVEEAYSANNDSHDRAPFNESVSTIKGRLWANVCQFTLDLNLYYDAYCAIISNPDEESKYISLRHLINVLYERGAIKILCGGQLPFIGLTEKVEQELAWKAERSDILAKTNLYKLLYAFEMHRHNWRKAASYMYLYSARLRTEASLKGYQQLWRVLKEILNGLSAAINALHLVHPAYAWIDPLLVRSALHNEQYPGREIRITIEDQPNNDVHPRSWKSFMDIQKIENEFVLTSAEHLLSLAHVKWTNTGTQTAPLELADLLIQTNLYDMAFTVLVRFFKGSELKRGLERVFSAMSLKCFPHIVDSSRVGDDPIVHGSPDMSSANQQSNGINQWGTLELYLDRYIVFHARLPLIVAETLLRTDSQIQLPLWLVKLFKDGRREKTLGMTGHESNPASLFQLYVDYGRHGEAINLLLEHEGCFGSMRPANIMNRKRPFGVWFPYTMIQRLWCQLEEMINSGHMVAQCKQFKDLLHRALLKHLQLVKMDSEGLCFISENKM
ncbi:nuclear pore complex protein NUP160 isoform X2 [Rosa chinensis]|uniref:nuclear pore complex protein NUP160 isoform X2 n=1 Tax=Rosa chinensis TaxID=74649 RepID=UPI001AD8FCDC|nr:nuclear pore complex protein NUP160 isoform X2 [Rosa chinensis]